MEEFLGLGKVHTGSYLIDFRPEKNKAYIKFLYDPKLYETDVKTLGKYHYKLVKGDRSREFKIAEDLGRPALWYFEDSSPYNPATFDVRDGDRSSYRDLKDGIKQLKEEFETPTGG